MDEQERFGELRSLVNGEPSEEAWDAICAILEDEDDDRVREELSPYLEHHLADWPDEIRVVPAPWYFAILAGEQCVPARLC